ncbi:Mth938-like domain-containing protein [Zoogloea sp.]|uniref:Mth938-like domain-containing protein n=1 Tax=Zoogloea sp. TaxID=49181 RepID=UPI00260D2E1E|nr:Mth938-like domain-containing protein [Zoogloea sp.]MDD3352849.1 Mth938-like domain-containing protein [Zoogloea sp.]
MKLHLDKNDRYHTIARYDATHVMIGQDRHERPIVVMPERLDLEWHQGGFDTLDESAFERLAGLGCEIVILGTGRRQRFPQPQLVKSLMNAGIGLEVMDLGSACRTYNILVAEHRNVAAALLFDPT